MMVGGAAITYHRIAALRTVPAGKTAEDIHYTHPKYGELGF